MYGAVTPWSVVVVATSDGGLFGSYAENCPVTDDLYSYWYVVGALHCGSLDPFWHTHGWTCGPVNTGPPIGWLAMVTCALAPGAVARRTLGPLARPVTRPS